MTQAQANKIARLYIATQHVLGDGFFAENIKENDAIKIDTEIKKIAWALISKFDVENLPSSAEECVNLVMKNKA